MDKQSDVKKSKTYQSPKLISYYVNNIEFNTTSTKPISHYVKSDEVNVSSAKPISHYIKADNLANSSTMLISKYLKLQDVSKENNVEAKVHSKETVHEVKRPRHKRNYISEFFKSNDDEPVDSIQQEQHNNLNYLNISQILKLKVNTDTPVQDTSAPLALTPPLPLPPPPPPPPPLSAELKSKHKSVLISDYIKTKQPNTDNSVYLAKSELISKLFKTNDIIPDMLISKMEEAPKEDKVEVAEETKKRNRNYISHYLKSKDTGPIESSTQEGECEMQFPDFPTFKRSKLISQYISEKSNDFEPNKGKKARSARESNPRVNRPRLVNRSRYISHVIRQNEMHVECSTNEVARQSPETLNQILRRNSLWHNSKNKYSKRMKNQREKFLNKFIKLDNIVSRLRKKKKLD